MNTKERAGKPRKYDKLYNENIKLKFLENRKPDTKRTYDSKLRAIAVYEYLFEKDLYSFDIEEIQMILNDKGGSNGAIKTWGSLIASYLKWINEHKISEVKEGILDRLNSAFYESFATPFFFTNDDIQEVVSKYCDNLEEKVIVLLLFEGLSAEEIIHLKYTDIASFELSKELLELINEFEKETEFISSYGKRKYIDNKQGFILRKINTNPNEKETAADSKIYYALRRIADRAKKSNLTPKVINRSGKLYNAMLLYRKDGILGAEQYNKIIKKFRMGKVLNNGVLTSPYYHLRSVDMINEDTIKHYYFNMEMDESQIQSNPLWKIKEQNGLAGEKVVFKYLEGKYPQYHIYKPADKEGYDIEVYKTGRLKTDKEVIKRVEVKTVQNNGRTLYLTINEVEKAKGFGDEYYLYIVNNLISEYNIYIIQNPIEVFNINLSELVNINRNSICSIDISSIKLRLNESFFNNIDPIVIPKYIGSGAVTT